MIITEGRLLINVLKHLIYFQYSIMKNNDNISTLWNSLFKIVELNKNIYILNTLKSLIFIQLNLTSPMQGLQIRHHPPLLSDVIAIIMLIANVICT